MGKDKFEPYDFIDFNSDKNRIQENSALKDVLGTIFLYTT